MDIGRDNEIFASAASCVDGAVGVPSPKWFVALVSPRHEKSVSEKLQGLGIESYVAVQNELHVWKDGRRKMVARVVIPSMVFVSCTEKQRREIVRLPYILRFLVDHCSASGGLNKPVAEIPDRQIRQLQFMLGHADTPVEFVPSVFHKKDNVRVIRGSFRGLEGQVIDEPDGTHSLTISLSVLGMAKVKIDAADLEKI